MPFRLHPDTVEANPAHHTPLTHHQQKNAEFLNSSEGPRQGMMSVGAETTLNAATSNFRYCSSARRWGAVTGRDTAKFDML